MEDSAAASARGLGVIGLLSAAFTLLATLLPSPAGLPLPRIAAVCAATALCSLVMFLPMWRRLPRAASLAMVPVALTLIAIHNLIAEVDQLRYGTFYLVLFVWIGSFHPPRTALLAAPLTLVSYDVPLVLTGHALSAWTAAYAIPMYVLVGEVLARRSVALKEANERLVALASTDPLTGLPNRRAFLGEMERGAPGDETAVAFVDLDAFKSVNDVHGHRTGDELLVRTAAALRASVRPGDVVARLAGDEFAVLLQGPVSQEDVEVVCRRLRAAVAAVAESLVPGLGVGASVGVARCGPDAEAALAAADQAMYTAKRDHRGSVVRL